MRIKDFLNKWLVSSENQLSPLRHQKERLSQEMLYQMKRVYEVRNWKYKLEKISGIYGMLLIIIAAFGSLAGAFGVIPLQPFIFSIFGISAASFVVYKVVESILDSKNPTAYYEVSNERAAMSRKLRECQDKINELEKVMGEVRKTDEFLKKLNQDTLLNEELPTIESQILFYIKENMSLLSILYLSKRKMLPGDIGHPLTLEELEKVKLLGKKIDEMINKDPNYFIAEDYNQDKIQSEKKERVRRSRIERNQEIENNNLESVEIHRRR